MYNSPIIITSDLGMKVTEALDEQIYQSVLNVGIDVDKSELLRALQYDRGQYEKGYADATPKWISVKDRLPERNEDGTVNAVLVTNGVIQHIAYLAKDVFYFTENGEMKEPMFYEVTHWQYLPQPPKGE